VLAGAIEGTSPKVVNPEVKTIQVALAAAPKPAAKPSRPPQPTLDAVKTNTEITAEAVGGDEITGEPADLQKVIAGTAAAAPIAAAMATAETVLSKTSPDGTPLPFDLPFAVKDSAADVGGVIVVPSADFSWHIQIGAYPNKEDAQAVLYRVRALDLDMLNNKQGLTIAVQKGKDTLYRARFSGFTEKNARTACQRLTRQGIGCVAMQPQS
jgi:D-alanyl-D-alanine carboxypeptidase